MDKPATVDHPVHPLIQARWSPRAFSERSVEREVLQSLLEAARWAPSAYNDQPWAFLMARREETAAFDRILEGLVPANQIWAKRASVLMVGLARTRFAHNGKPNRHALYDLGQAVATMTIEAVHRGLLVHQMGGIRREALRDAHQLPRGIEPVCGIAMGYPGDPDALPVTLAGRERAPRSRHPQGQFVYTKRYGEAW